MHKTFAILIVFIIGWWQNAQCQSNKATRNNDYTSLYLLNGERNKGFEISLSGVMMFTTGANDRRGLRWGAGLTVSKDFGDFRLFTGLDAYKAQQNFGIGTAFAGFSYNDGKYGGSYYINRYFQGDKQISGILGIDLNDFQIRFEDDILALPFTNFVIYDRFRTAALEIRYRHFIIGTNVYTNEVNGLTNISSENAKGTYYSGKQISSPVYIGYTNKNLILRYGINSKLGGFIGQNWWHQKLFKTSDFQYNNLKQHFLQLGIDKPYTLY